MSEAKQSAQLVVPKVRRGASRDIVRQLAEALNALTRARAAMMHAGTDLLDTRNYSAADHARAVEAWNDRRQMLGTLDEDLRDLALAIQEQE